MLTDDDISDTRYSRCVLGAVLASVIGDTAVYISTRAEHHGPLGGGTLAIIARQFFGEDSGYGADSGPNSPLL
jgi:cyanuric acid amidohydrolase